MTATWTEFRRTLISETSWRPREICIGKSMSEQSDESGTPKRTAGITAGARVGKKAGAQAAPASDQVVELLTEIRDLLKSQQQGQRDQFDQNPWTTKLIQECTSGEDMDGNDMVWGEDFVFAENLENHPPILQSFALRFKEMGYPSGSVRGISFEAYRDSLNDLQQKQKIIKWLAKLDERRFARPESGDEK